MLNNICFDPLPSIKFDFWTFVVKTLGTSVEKEDTKARWSITLNEHILELNYELLSDTF